MLRERRRHANYKPNRRLDRKSSRGMIYENEELRLRTININAEVERGQSDIRKLRRENEQLRREIWSLRDEYDRLNKLLKTHKTTENDGNNSESSHTEESDSCDTCKEEDIEEEIDEEECLENKFNKKKHDKISNQEVVENYENSQKSLEHSTSSTRTDGCSTPIPPTNSIKQQKENLHVNFDHLSIVSEENLTNSDGNSVQQGDMETANTSSSTQSIIEQKHIEQQQRIMNRLSDIQSIAPPLSHFENIAYDKLGPKIIEDNNCSTSTTTTGETIVPANGWDFSAPSPYSFRAGNSANASNAIVKPTSVEIKNSACFSQKTPTHFFSPIKPRIRIEPRKTSAAINNGPDVFVSNALASPYHRQNLAQPSSLAPVEPLYASIHHKNTSRTISPVPFQRGGNLEDLLSDIETLSNDILQMQLEKQKSYSQEKLGTCENLSNRKPYRSEMNLVLTYNGSNPVITPITKNTVSSSATALDTTNPYAMDTPPPNLPEPMILFPQNLTYLGFENCTHLPAVVPLAAGQLIPIIQQQQQHEHITSGEQYPTVLPNYPNDNATVHVPTPTVSDMSSDPPQSPPPGFLQGNLPCKGSSTGGEENNTEEPPEMLSGRSPTLMRRKTFAKRSTDSQISRSFDGKLSSLQVPAMPERSKITRAESSTSENANCDVQSSSGSETAKRKSRRVSILFKKSEDKLRDKNKDKEKDKDKKTGEDITIVNKCISRDQHSESAVNLSLAVAESVDNLSKKSIIGITAHSTPNSPHSGGRRSNSAHHHHSHHHHHGHHHHHQPSSGQKITQDLGTNKSPSGGGGGGGGGSGGGGGGQQPQQQDQQQQTIKSSRRHSDGTVIQTSLSSAAAGLSSSHHGIHDSYHEPGTSVSERNSNSLASSRESSTSLSMRSQRRKISVSSHNGGKIPWCGCWGNGCV